MCMSSSVRLLMPKHLLISRALILFIITGTMVSFSTKRTYAQLIPGTPVFRITPSTPEQLLTKIYNNALLGNDRLLDIEPYLSRDLKKRYKKALNQVKNGKTCDIPIILSNRYFSGKLRGFKVVDSNANGEFAVIIDTGSNILANNSEFKRFDSSVYEKITFKFKNQFGNWRIDDISASEPDLATSKVVKITYRVVNLRDTLNQCITNPR